MPRPQPKKATRSRKTFDQQVIAKVGKRPVSRNQVAEKLGVPPQAVARALGKAHQQGILIKTDKGYQKAL